MFVKAIPSEFWNNEIITQINHHSIVLVGAKSDDPLDPPDLRGSGSLIKYNDHYFILTAQHVIDHLKKYDSLGFVYGEDSNRRMHKLSIFNFHEIAVPISESDDPDVGLISIPNNLLGYFKQKKSFVNLLGKGYLMDHEALLIRNDLWVISGAVSVLSKLEIDKKKFTVALMCYAGDIPRFTIKGKYDYYEMDAYYKPDTMTPESFKGMSGGGLWKIKIRVNDGEFTIADNAKLIGVNYYQSDMIGDKRTIKGHGPITIYNVVAKYINKFV